MSVVVDILAVIALFLIVVGVHELGHFTFGKIFGIRVDEYNVGFGPRLVSRQWGETEYAIRAIPVGGYVRMAGMIGIAGEPDAGDRNFHRAPVPKRIVTLLGGVLFNIVFAGVVATVVFLMPTPSSVVADGPAARAGIQDGDSILSINGQQIDHSNVNVVSDSLRNALDATQGHKATVLYRASDGSMHTTVITPELGVVNSAIRPDPCGGTVLPFGNSLISKIDGKNVATGNPVQLLSGAHTVSGVTDNGGECNGATFSNRTIPGTVGGLNDASATVTANWRVGISADYNGMSLGTAIADGWETIPNFFHDQAVGISELFTNSNTGGPFGANGFASPVGIAAQTVASAQGGWQTYLGWIATISLSLALVNVLPIPFLDGGKVLIVAIEGIRRKRLNPQRELAIYAASATVVILFVVFVLFSEIHRWLNGGQL